MQVSQFIHQPLCMDVWRAGTGGRHSSADLYTTQIKRMGPLWFCVSIALDCNQTGTREA